MTRLIWLTADLHLDHEAIIGYTGRPFRSAAEMNGVLIGNILESVAATDTLYVLGDFAFRRETFDAYRHALGAVCDVRILRGNHDSKQAYTSGLACDFRWNHRHFYLCHYPWQTWRPNTVMLHGHCHGNPLDLPKDSRQHMRYDVGVDVEWEGRKFYPVSIEQVERRIEAGRGVSV